MYTRRHLVRLAAGTLPLSAASARINSKVRGVQCGLQSYVFFGLPGQSSLDNVIASMVETGLGECDIFSPLTEPADLVEKARGPMGAARGGTPPQPPAPGAPPDPRAQAREELAKWRRTAPLDYFKSIRKKFAAAGVDIYGYSVTPGNTDEEIERTFEIAATMGVRLVTTSSTLSAAKRIAPLAEKHKILVGFQGNPNMNGTNPDQINKPEQYEAAVALSKNFRISFDIGDATGGGYDALQFVKDHHEHLALLYIKDRKKDRTSVPWGEGDTPIKEILQLVRDKKYPIRCYVDCDYRAGTPKAADVKRSYEYMKKALAG